jgi:hypothetical protein
LSRDSVRPSDAAIVSAAEEIKAAARSRRVRNILVRHSLADEINVSQLVVEIGGVEAYQASAPLLDDAAVLDLPEPHPIVTGRLIQRTLAALVGPPGVGKTFCALDVGLSIAAGEPWLNAPIATRGPVVYVAAEGAPAPRIGAWKISRGFALDKPLGLHTWSGSLNLLDAFAVAAFVSAVKALSPVLVILDTFARCFVGGDENSAKDVGVAVSSLDRIRMGLDATVLVIHHMNKGGTSERGSGALRGACDTLMYLQAADDLLQLTCDKQKDSQPFEPVNVKLVPAFPGSKTCVARLAAEVTLDEELTDPQGRALHALRELFGDRGATAGEWEAALQSMPRATYYRARKVLIDRGYVRASEEGKTSRFRCTAKQPVSRRLTLVSDTSRGTPQGVSWPVSVDSLGIS